MATDWTRNLRLRQLKMLERMCETRNLSQVAQEFQLTQPALSKWLRDFEEDLGTRLFQRHARGMTPLPIALELARQAKAITGRLDRARQTVEQMVGAASGQITLGASPMVAIVLLPQLVQALHLRCPTAVIEIIEGPIDTLIPRLRSGALDLIIARVEAGDAPHDMHHERLCSVGLCLAACRTHPLANRPTVTWEEALSYPWIAPGRHSPIRQQLDLAFESLGVGSPNVLIESSSVSTTARILPGTAFIAPMASFLAHSVGVTTTINVSWAGLNLSASMDMIWRPDDTEFALLDTLKACVREQALALQA
ncbi:LysR family transcriptional regulator [Pusillimonas sp. TS35]|uniref:LysR family transcriptional regulator n=1 Tax=Paracandidimonas lactea TaxID=2895524 RepID=UPI00136BB896|nr:LysR family transcriptional regulator [Paracandidimonas lactea]MYN13471.1 LysR family transcriptional regulator [Pusillimonas sp. TS35]